MKEPSNRAINILLATNGLVLVAAAIWASFHSLRSGSEFHWLACSHDHPLAVPAVTHHHFCRLRHVDVWEQASSPDTLGVPFM